MNSLLIKHVQLFEHEFYIINPENEDHILLANTPVICLHFTNGGWGQDLVVFFPLEIPFMWL